MSEINGLPMRNIESTNDRVWFSYIKRQIENAKYGTLELKLTLKEGMVTNIKDIVESSFSVHNRK